MTFSETFSAELGEGLGAIILAILSIIWAFFFMVFILMIGVYVYSSFAYMNIGKKAKYKNPGIAWIPIVGKPLLTARIAKMHWWPILLLLGGFLSVIPIVGSFIAYVCFLTFTIFFFVWRWKTYEKVGHPGWFSILFLIPVIGYVFLGIVAWSKENIIQPIKKKKK